MRRVLQDTKANNMFTSDMDSYIRLPNPRHQNKHKILRTRRVRSSAQNDRIRFLSV